MKGKILMCIGVALIAIGIGGMIMAHERTNLIRDDMCLVEGIPKENIAVVSVQMFETSVGLKSPGVGYPTGFTKDNCVPIAIMYNKSKSSPDWQTAKVEYNSESDTYYVNPTIKLESDHVRFNYYVKTKSSVAGDIVTAKVVLMKI